MLLISDHISEKEIIDLMKKLDQDILIQDSEEDGLSSTNMNIDEKIVDGYIKVEDGKIIVSNPSNGGKVPIINAKPPVKLFVGGYEIIKRTKVSSESELEWRIEEIPLFEISVSENKLKAQLIIHRTQRHAWSLAEKSSALNVTLIAEEDNSIILETLNLQDILTPVNHMNIMMHLDIIAIQAEVLNPSYKTTVIARGKAPVQGQDAILDLYFSNHIENTFTEVSGQMDYKNHLNIPSVKSGDVIARKSPPIEGIAGYDVYGNVLLPDSVKDIQIAVKNNVEVTPDFIVIARKEGRPRVTGDKIKYFDINTAHIVPGNVDLETGNIFFAGDVSVYGDVMDNMIIESLGNIYISGSVFNSTLTATGSIVVKGNVIGSNLYSGYFGMLYNRLYNSSKQLTDILEKMMQSSKKLLNEIDKKGIKVRYGQVLLLIIESKYQQTGYVVKELLGVISSIQSYNKDVFQQLKNYLELFIQPTKIVEIMTAPRMEVFIRVLKDAFMRVALSQESQVAIFLYEKKA